jgi:hypothetical protein
MHVLDRYRNRIGLIARAASAAWVTQSLASLAFPDPTSLLDVTMIVPVLLTTAVLWLLNREGAFGSGRLSRIVGVLCGFTAATVVPGQLAFAFEWSGAGMAVAIVETVTFIGSLVIAGIAAILAHVLPRWMGIALIVAQPLAIVLGIAFSPISPLASHGDYTGALGHAIVWGLIAAALLGKRIPYLNEEPRQVLIPAEA